MSDDIEITCPFGSVCEEIRNNKRYRCAWYIQLQGNNPQTGEEIDEWGCAMGWLPILLVENISTSKGTSAAVESFRNEVVESTNKPFVGGQMPVVLIADDR